MSKLINKALLTEQLKRLWAIPALSFTALMLLVYLPLVNDRGYGRLSLRTVLEMQNFFMLFVMVVTCVMAAFSVFRFFFNRRASTSFYAMPLNKTQLFSTNALAGIILSLLPIFAFCLVLLIPLDNSFSAYEYARLFEPVKNTPPAVLLLFLRMSLSAVFYFALAWLAFSLAGHGLIALLIVAVMPFVPLAFYGLLEVIGNMYVFGYYSMNFGTTYGFFIAYHTPVAWGILTSLGYGSFATMVVPFITYTVLTLAFFAGAYFISRSRKPERTGDSVIFAPVKNVLIFLVAFLAQCILGMIFYAFNRDVVMMHVGFVLGFLIGYVIAQMIAEKSFHILEKIKYTPHFVAVAAGLYIFMLIFTQYGMGFFVNRVPHENQIYGVYASQSSPIDLSYESWQRFAITDPEAIAAVQEIHRLILNNKSEVRRVPNIETGIFTGRQRFSIQYVLNNGRVVTRQYALTHNISSNELFENYFQSDAFLLAQHPGLRMPETLRSIHFNFTIEDPISGTISRPSGELSMRGPRMQTAVDLITQGYLETLQRDNREYEPEIRVGIWLHYNNTRDNPFRHSARNITITGEPARRIYEQALAWGIIEFAWAD
jgi:ABC-2 type transport system permease protein